jgi:hypothetical protein
MNPLIHAETNRHTPLETQQLEAQAALGALLPHHSTRLGRLLRRLARVLAPQPIVSLPLSARSLSTASAR